MNLPPLLKLAICANLTCSSSSIQTLDSGKARSTSLSLTSADIPVIAFGNAIPTAGINIIVCPNVACTGSASIELPATTSTGSTISLALAPGNIPVVAFQEGVAIDLKLAVCGTSTCTIGNVVTNVDATDNMGRNPDVVVNSSGLPIISHMDNTNSHLRVVRCGNLACSSGNTYTNVDVSADLVGGESSIVLNAGENPVIAYYDYTNSDLKLAVDIPSATPTPTITQTATQTNTALPTATHTATVTQTATSTNTPLPTATHTITFTPTLTSTSLPTATLTPIPAAPDKVGVFKDGIWYLRFNNAPGLADVVTSFGLGSDYPVTGDWNGDGVDTLGLLRPSDGRFLLSNSNTVGVVAYNFIFGNPNDTPLAGRWDSLISGDGVGVFRPSNGIIYLTRNLITGFSDYYLVMGDPGDIGLAGDWDANGFDSVGVYRPSNTRWYLSNVNGNGITFSDVDFIWVVSGKPFAGNWLGTGSKPGQFSSQRSGT
jgi:hypothetical protein